MFTSTISISKWTVLCVLTFAVLTCLNFTWAKLCCDQDCIKPISYGRTKDRYITQEIGYLSFPNAAIVTVLVKQAAVDGAGQEMWLAEIQSRKGLIPADFVSELHILCEPKHIVKEESYTPDHNIAKGDNADQRPYHSDIHPVQTTRQPESILFQSPDTLHQHQGPQSTSMEWHQRDQRTEYTVHPQSSNDAQPFHNTDQQITTSHEQPQPNIHASNPSNVYLNAHEPIVTHTPDNIHVVQSIPMEQPRENDNGAYGRNTQEDDVPGARYRMGHVSSFDDFTSDASTPDKEGDDWELGDETQNEQQDENSHSLQSDYVGGTDPSNEMLSNDQIDVKRDRRLTEDRSVGSEVTSLLDHPGDRASIPPPAHFTYQNDCSSEQSHQDTGPPRSEEHERDNEAYIPSPHSQLMDYDYIPGGVRENKEDNVVKEQVKKKGGVDAIPETMLIEENAEMYTGESLVDEGYPSDVNNKERSYESRSEEALQPDLNMHGHTATVHSTVDNYRQTHSYLDVQLLRQRYQHDRASVAAELDDTGAEKLTGHPSPEIYTATEQVHSQQTKDPYMYIPTPNNDQQLTQQFDTHFDGERHLHAHPPADREQVTQHTNINLPTPDIEQATQHINTHHPTQDTEQQVTQHTDSYPSASDAEQVTHTPLPAEDSKHLNEHLGSFMPTPDAEQVSNLYDTNLPTPDGDQVTKQHTESHLPTQEVVQITQQHHMDHHLPTPDTEQVPQQHKDHHHLSIPDAELPDATQLSSPDPEEMTQYLPPKLPTPEIIHHDISQSYHEVADDESLQKEPAIDMLSFYTKSMDLITKFLPPSLASWILKQGPELGIVGVTASLFSIIIPLCCSCCHFWRDSKRKAKTISNQTASRRALEEQMQKFKSEKNAMHTELLMSEEKYGNLENQLEHLQQRNRTLIEANADLEENYGTVRGDLSSVQQELMQCNAQVDQLRSKLKHEQMQLSAQTSDKEVALQQIALLRGQIQEYQQSVQELEAAKEQLEENAFTTNSSLQQLEAQHKQVSQELAGSKAENSQLKSKLQSLQEDVSSFQQYKEENEHEIQTLKNCLSQLMTSNTAGGDGQAQEEVDGTKLANDETLYKIQAMLETTKARIELQKATEERDNTATALAEQTMLVKELQAKKSSLHDHIQELESRLSKGRADFEKLQDKHRTLTEYFEQKEHNLHRMLGAEEAVRQAVETREAQVKERAESLEQTETRHKEELRQLRSEMFEIEKSLMSQVHTCQKRAEEAIAEQRRLEQECKALKLERENMRKRFTIRSGSPASGSSIDRQHSLMVRPPSAPYLPRTSSPGAVDSPDHDQMTSMLNNTDPLPVSHQVLIHPIPDRERPRYPPPPPPPPPSHRIARGYPPFDRHHPMPRLRGHYGPMHRFHHGTNPVLERRRPLSNPPLGARSTPPLGVFPPHPSNNPPNRFVPVPPAVPEAQPVDVLNPCPEERDCIGNHPEV